TPDIAMEQARAAEARALAGELLGLMDGIPVSIKDLEPMAGVRCTFGSKLGFVHIGRRLKRRTPECR
ncbi:MAG TPA: hypothetical protein VFW27_06590, partial [Actinoplanes sp.]|nr:hypothetical protein [Actinoplanes sp.]